MGDERDSICAQGDYSYFLQRISKNVDALSMEISSSNTRYVCNGSFRCSGGCPSRYCCHSRGFEDAFHQLPKLLSADSNARKLRARHLLNVATSGNHTASSAPEPGEIVVGETSSSSNSSPSDLLDLATAAFTARR